MKRNWIVLLLAGLFLLSACQTDSTSKQASAKAKQNKVSVKKSAAKKKKAVKTKNQKITSVKISFDFSRMSTEASNQVAVWVEDQKGNVVKTIYVSDFTGVGRGYKWRKDTIPHWVAAANPDQMSNKAVDAVSSATLQDGKKSFSWNLKNNKGKTVTKGKYTIKVEGTLYWSSNVVYSGTIDTANGHPGKLSIKKKRSKPHDTDNATMIRNVKMTAK